jgi:hypothetical protein
MRCPSIAISTLTALSLGVGAAQADEMFTPPASLQQVPNPGRIIISPDAQNGTSSGVAPVPSEALSVAPIEAASMAEPQPPTALEVAATPIEHISAASQTAASETSQPLPQLVSNAPVDPTVESPAASLGGSVAVNVDSAATQCPLKLETMSFSADQMAQAGTTQTGPCPRPEPLPVLIVPRPLTAEASPAFSIYIPVGFGLDGGALWGSGGFQAGVREDPGSVGGGGLGFAIGDAKKYVGLELGYTFVDGDNFGIGGFSGKLHRRLGNNASIAFGWNGFANLAGRNDFEQSLYGAFTYVFRFAPSLDSAFSRMAVTVGVGDGQFRSNLDRDLFRNGANVFGNIAFRVVRPVSLIAEWTGQDLALGLSIAPFKNFPFVITPAVRDVTGSGYAPRFVIGAGVSFSLK